MLPREYPTQGGPSAVALRALEEKPRGLQVLARRWVVGRTFFAWLGLSRRFSKAYERLPDPAEAMIYGAMSRLMLRRLAQAA
jgi:putative transposase